MNTLAAILIVILLLILAHCIVWLIQDGKERSEQRTSDRRAYYRLKAYKDKAKQRALKKARQMLWEDIRRSERYGEQHK